MAKKNDNAEMIAEETAERLAVADDEKHFRERELWLASGTPEANAQVALEAAQAAWEEKQAKRHGPACLISASGYRNDVILRGNVGNPPKLIPLAFGKAKQKAVFQIVTRELRKRDGEWFVHDEWHRCYAVGGIAKLIAKKVGRGAHIFLEGKLQTEEWKDKTTGLKKIATRVVVINFDVLQEGEGK